jgi:hypothetical protein
LAQHPQAEVVVITSRPGGRRHVSEPARPL